MKNQNYISKNLAHFVGSKITEDKDKFKLLIKIIKEGHLLRGSQRNELSREFQGMIFSLSSKLSDNDYDANAVCFCDIPYNNLKIHTNKYGCFGISFSKIFLMKQGVRPVFYIPHDVKSKSYDTIEDYINNTIKTHTVDEIFDRNSYKIEKLDCDILKSGKSGERYNKYQDNMIKFCAFLNFQVFGYTKFFDSNLPDDDPNNFYMEREWRTLDDVTFKISDIINVFLPKKYEKTALNEIPELEGKIMPIEEYDNQFPSISESRKAEIKAAAEMQGESFNDFIVKAIDERMKRLKDAKTST